MAKVLVTGGCGRLGSYVGPRLIEAGHEVTNFDSVSPTPSANPIPFVQGDLTSLEDCLRAVIYSQAEVIVHLGALPGPREMVHAPGWRIQQVAREDTTMRVNTMGTYYLLEAARKVGTVRQVVFASSFYALGIGNRISGKPFEVDYLPIDEAHPLRPEDSYGISKVFGEELLQTWGRAWGIHSVALRLMGVWYENLGQGPDLDVNPESTPDHRGGPVGHSYQYVDARDVANACALAIEKAPELDEFEAFYLTTDTTYREETKDLVARVWPDLAELAKDIPGTEGVITDAKARLKLGYVPQFSWRATS